MTSDVSSLYTNIPIFQGIEAFRFFLDRRDNKTVPTKFLITLLTLILTCNILVLDGDHYLQLIGVAMGTRFAPTLACLFMGAFEHIALKKWKGVQPYMYKRYIDDIFFLWRSSEKELKDFINHLNSLHPFIKFKANYDINKKSVEFLDTIISINSRGFIKTDLFEKPGRVCNFLSPKSCHPSHITENIPYSLALRLKRICSEVLDFLKRLDELKAKLISRGYRKNFISKAFEKVKQIDRKIALKKVEKKTVQRSILSLPYDPHLPNVSNILYRFLMS